MGKTFVFDKGLAERLNEGMKKAEQDPEMDAKLRWNRIVSINSLHERAFDQARGAVAIEHLRFKG